MLRKSSQRPFNKIKNFKFVGLKNQTIFVICVEEPKRPSTRLTGKAAAADLVSKTGYDVTGSEIWSSKEIFEKKLPELEAQELEALSNSDEQI